MSFEHDIFISYAHIDNQPFGDTKGWIDQLFERLKVRLAQLLGAEPIVWWDGRLQGDQYFAGEIGDSVSATLLLAPVVTPRYVKSAWCRGELAEFCRRALQTNDERMRNHSRIFKIVKTPVNDDQQPEELRGLLGYVFYELDANDRPREFSAEVAPAKDPKYWARLDDLAWDIKNAIEKLKPDDDRSGFKIGRGAVMDIAEGADDADAGLPLEKKVYLAETTADLAGERDRIRRELQQRGFQVLPDRELTLYAPDFEAEVREQLSRCALSVHLIGANYGIIPEGEEEHSILRWQEELAAERGRSDPDFTRLVWMPKGLEAKGARQQRFIEELQTGLGAGAELLQTSLEELKTRVLEKLAPPPKPAAPAPQTNGNGDDLRRVYLICDNRDLGEVEPIEEYLFNQGYEVLPSIDGADGAEVAQYHRESLLGCDAALIYYGNANQLWLRSKMGDLQKAQGWGRTAPMVTKGVYVSGPPTAEKQRFRTREVPVVIQNFQRFSPDALQPFLQALREGNGGQR
ncbi:MAG: hypothetical protein LC802_03490 [Acidobacteria bacterium]|nr:hypothetical protein [Acidobacteriota bacterium]